MCEYRLFNAGVFVFWANPKHEYADIFIFRRIKMKKVIVITLTIVAILLSCTTVKEPTESIAKQKARIDAERKAKLEARWEAAEMAKKQKKEAFIQPLSDPRFNGTFYEKGKEFYDERKWQFNGTNEAFYYNGWDSYVNSSWYPYEIRIEDGVLYHATWPLSGYREAKEIVLWRKDGEYSFTKDGDFVLTYESKTREGEMYSYTRVFLRDRSED
jgi:hypothetical protein